MTQLKSARITLLIGFLLLTQFSFSQQQLIREPDPNRPRAFAGFPDSLVSKSENTGQLFSVAKSDHVSVLLAENLLFEGIVTGKKIYDEYRRAILVRSTNYPGFTLSLFQQVNTDGSTTIRGRILSFTHGDAFVLQYKQGIYKWVKKGFYELVNE